jgi:hypothetical protein
MSFGTLGKKITNAFKLHKEANGNMAKLEINLVSDGWKVTSRQSSTPTPTPTTTDISVSKRKYASIGSSQMRSGRSSTIQTSSTGLMSSAKIGKKTLLGS